MQFNYRIAEFKFVYEGVSNTQNDLFMADIDQMSEIILSQVVRVRVSRITTILYKVFHFY
jgi:hypothetical protein